MESKDDNETITGIQDELQQLQGQVAEQYRKIQELQQRLQLLNPSYKPNTAAVGTKESTNWKWENFIGLRLIHLVGIIVLVIGLSIGVKYAIDQELISPAARIGLAYVAGATLYILSLRLRKDYLLFSAILFSGAMASLYFTTYAAFVYYHMLPSAMTFLLMVALTVFTSIKAGEYNRQEIALLGLVGAYGIPFLISQNADRSDLFFIYILIINLGVLSLSYKKGWKVVGYIAFLITWTLFIGWSLVRFEPSQRWIGVLFGSLFFLLFTAMALSRGLLRGDAISKGDAYLQLANNVALYLASLFILGNDMKDDQLAAITGCFGLFLGLQSWAYHARLPNKELLHRVHLVASFSLIILFVALEWDGVSITFIWLLMAVVLFVWGAWQKMMVLRLGAIGLLGLTLIKLVALDSTRFTTVQKVIAYLTLGVLLLVISFFYQKFKQKLFGE